MDNTTARTLKDSGNAKFKHLDFEGAISDWTAAIRTSDDAQLVATCNSNIAIAYVKKNDWPNVCAFASAALQSDASNFKSLYWKGVALRKLGRVDEAICALQLALDVQMSADAIHEISKCNQMLSPNAESWSCSWHSTSVSDQQPTKSSAGPKPGPRKSDLNESKMSSCPHIGNAPSPTTVASVSQHRDTEAAQRDGARPWTCQVCSFDNAAIVSAACLVCSCPNPHLHCWACTACTFENSNSHLDKCKVCGFSRVPAFVSSLKANPAFALARPGHEFVAELKAHSVYCLASQISLRRWTVRAPGLKQWHALGTGIGQRQRRAVVFRGGLFEQLVRRLLLCPSNLNAMLRTKHAKFVLMKRHFLGLQNQADRLFREGRSLYDEQLFTNAAKCWAQAILLRHPESHAHLATMLIERRRGVPLDENLAFQLAKAGARLHCMHSIGVVSRCLNGGCGVKSDLARAFAFARTSHASGSSFGTFALADCYREGRGVAKDLAYAVRLYRLVAAKGHVVSFFALALCLIEQFPLKKWPSCVLWDLEEAEDSRKQVLLHLQHAAERGYSVAQNFLAGLYRNGLGVMQDEAQFNRWASLAAEQGCKLPWELF